MALKLLTQELRKEFTRSEMIEIGRNNIDVFAAGLLNIVLWGEQLDFIENADAPHNTLSAGRRFGKAVVMATLSIRSGFYRLRILQEGKNLDPNEQTMNSEKYTILVASKTQAQANIIQNEIKRIITHKDSLLKGYYVKVDNSQGFPILIIKSLNGEEFHIHSRSLRDDDNLQGWSYDIVIIDEAARIKGLENDIYFTLQPFTNDTDGIMFFVSSPVPLKNGFYTFHQKGLTTSKSYDPEWKSFYGDSRNNPYLGKKSREEFDRKYPSKTLADIYLGGQFLDGGDEIFRHADIMGIFIKPKFDTGIVFTGDEQPFVYDKFSGNCQNLIHCFDIASERDWTVGFTLDITNYFSTGKIPIMGFQRFQGNDYPTIVQKIIMQQKTFGGGRIVIEKNNTGGAVADYVDQELGKDFVERIWTGSNKEDMIINLQRLVYAHAFSSPDIPPLEDELIAYQMKDKGIVQDCVMALAVGVYALDNPEAGYKHVKSEKSLDERAVEVLKKVSGARKARSWDL